MIHLTFIHSNCQIPVVETMHLKRFIKRIQMCRISLILVLKLETLKKQFVNNNKNFAVTVSEPKKVLEIWHAQSLVSSYLSLKHHVNKWFHTLKQSLHSSLQSFSYTWCVKTLWQMCSGVVVTEIKKVYRTSSGVNQRTEASPRRTGI